MLVTDQTYHLINRGIEDRIIFQEEGDYNRFLSTLLECNSRNSMDKNRSRRVLGKMNTVSNFDTEPLVDILCICLMPNHFHMAAKQLVDGGISKFMQRLGNSYTKYFNIKYRRKGSLFMARYKNVHVTTDSQLRHLVTYIHANALDLGMPEWREGKLKNFKKAKEFLENYFWSSYPVYSRSRNLDLISRIISRESVDVMFEKSDYFNSICSWSNRYFENFRDFE